MKYYKVILKTGDTVVMSTGYALDVQAARKNIPDIRYEEISETEFNAFAEANKCYNEKLREIVTRWNDI